MQALVISDTPVLREEQMVTFSPQGTARHFKASVT
jgi:hypothetical protein